MLQKNAKYYNKIDNKTYELIDYVFYNGTNEHGFTFSVDFQIIKKTIKQSKLNEFLSEFIIKNHVVNSSEEKVLDSIDLKKNDMQDKHISEAKDILLETIKDLRGNKIKVDVADSIAKTSQTLVNCVRTELLIKNSNNKN
jgi:hypothetical protein